MSDIMNTQMIDFEKEGIVVERQTDSGHLTLSEFEEKLNTPGVSRHSELQGRKLPRASLIKHGQNVGKSSERWSFFPREKRWAVDVLSFRRLSSGQAEHGVLVQAAYGVVHIAT